MDSPRIYKLVARSIRRPSVWNETALPIGYFDNNFNGQPLPTDWKPPAHCVRGASYRPSDCISWQEPRPLLSERAVDVFEEIAPACAEYRQFTTIKNRPYFVMNVTASEDIFDEDSSKVTRTASGQIVTVVRYAFRDRPTKPLFKLPARFASDTLCTETIPAAVVKHKLTGFGFWDPAHEVLRDLYFGKDPNCYPGVLP